MGSTPQLAAPRQGRQEFLHDFYIYAIESGNIFAANGSKSTASVTIDDDSDFRWYGLTADTNPSVAGNWSLYLENASQGNAFMPVPIVAANLAGRSSLSNLGTGPVAVAMWLPKPYLIPRGSILNALLDRKSVV